MNMFANVQAEGMEESKDVVGGNFDPLPTDIYDATIKLAYAGESKGGAKNVTLILNANGQEVRQTIYVTTKQGEAFYLDKENKKQPLPGWSTIEDLCLFACEKDLTTAEMEEKTVKVFDPAEGKEVNKAVPVLVELLTKPVKVAIQRQIVDKEKQGDDGEYHPTGETRVQNEIIKFLHPETSRTINEYKREIDEPIWANEWLTRFRGKDRNRATKSGGNTAGNSGSGRPGAGGAGSGKPATSSLFGSK